MKIPMGVRLNRHAFVPPATKKKNIKRQTEHLPAYGTIENKARLQKIANKRDISLRTLMCEIVEKYLEENGNSDGAITEGQSAEEC